MLLWRQETNAAADQHKKCHKSFDSLQEKVLHVSQKPSLKQCNTNPGTCLFDRTNPKMTSMQQNGLHGHCESTMKPKDINVVQVNLWV